MLVAPIPGNEVERLSALRAGSCAYAPREERFDRITRTAKRLLHVPIALITIVEHDEQWFRSVQGLDVDHMPRDISFCGHAVALNKLLCIPDTFLDPDFFDNPLVVRAPHIRSYLGWPLEIAPGLAVGSLCVIDTMPRTFGPEDFEALRDLASMAEAELKVTALADLQKKMLMQLNTLQRKGALDSLTGCWNIRGFRELLAIAFNEARSNHTDLAVCHIRVDNLEQAVATDSPDEDAAIALLAQVLRQRLPTQGALARLGPRDFCALVPSGSALALEDELAKLTFPVATVDLPKSHLKVVVTMTVNVSWLAELGPEALVDGLWANVLRNIRTQGVNNRLADG